MLPTPKSIYPWIILFCLFGLLPNAQAKLAESVNLQSPVSYEKALTDALRVASLNADWQVMQARGRSMHPYFSEQSLLIVEKVAFRQLKPGMFAVYESPEGELIGHRILRNAEDGWIAQGINNPESDPYPVTSKNFVGIIFGVINAQLPSGKDITHYAQQADKLPIVIGKEF